MSLNLKSFFSFHIISKIVTFLSTIIITRQMNDASLKGKLFTFTVFKTFLGMIIGREALYSSFVRTGIRKHSLWLWISLCTILLLYLVCIVSTRSNENAHTPFFTEKDPVAKDGSSLLSRFQVLYWLYTFYIRFLSVTMMEKWTFHIFTLAIIMEFITDLLMIESQYREVYHLRIRNESVALFIKGVLMSLYLTLNQEINALQIERAFVVSELGYSLVLVVLYLLWYHHYLKEQLNLKASTISNLAKGITKVASNEVIPQKADMNFSKNDPAHYSNNIGLVQRKGNSPKSNSESDSQLEASSRSQISKNNKNYKEHDVFILKNSSHSWRNDIVLFLQFYVFDSFRFLLQEGEKLALLGTATLSEQGIYDMVSNLGSLVVRLIFLPVEQIAFASWSKLLHDKESNQCESCKDPHDQMISKSSKLKHLNKKMKSLEEAYFILQVLLKLLSVIALLFFCFGPPFSKSLLHILYGSQWSETKAPTLLRIYSVYISFVALNGVSEAFVRAAATGSTLGQYSRLMTIVSIVYVITCTTLTYAGLGAEALIFSSILNKLLRTCYSFWFIHHYFNTNCGSLNVKTNQDAFSKIESQEFQLKTSPPVNISNVFRFIPHHHYVICCLLSFVICQVTEIPLCNVTRSHLGRLLHLCLGISCFIISCIIFWKKEQSFIHNLRSIKK